MCLINNLEIIGRNYTKKNKCIIKGMIRRKTSRDLRKLFKYQHIYSMFDKKMTKEQIINIIKFYHRSCIF